MKTLPFLRAIAQDEATFLSLIEEIDTWRNDEGITLFHVSLERFSHCFTEEEKRKALDLACEALRSAETDRQTRRTPARKRKDYGAGHPLLPFR